MTKNQNAAETFTLPQARQNLTDAIRLLFHKNSPYQQPGLFNNLSPAPAPTGQEPPRKTNPAVVQDGRRLRSTIQGEEASSWNAEDESKHPRGQGGKFRKKASSDIQASMFQPEHFGYDDLGEGFTQGTTPRPASPKSQLALFHDHIDLAKHAAHKALHQAGIAKEPPKPLLPSNYEEIRNALPDLTSAGDKGILIFKHNNTYRAHGSDGERLRKAIGVESFPHHESQGHLENLVKQGHRIGIAEKASPVAEPRTTTAAPAAAPLSTPQAKSTPAPTATPAAPVPAATPSRKPTPKEFETQLFQWTNLIRKKGKSFHVKEQDMDDFIQDVQLNAIKGQDSYDSTKATFGMWIGTVAENHAKEILRRSKRKKRDGGPVASLNAERSESSDGEAASLAGQIPDHRESSIIGPGDRLDLDVISEHFEGLSQTEQELIKAVYMDGMQQSEVARKNNVSDPYVSRTILTGLKKIRESIESGRGINKKDKSGNLFPVSKSERKLQFQRLREEAILTIYRKFGVTVAATTE